MKNHCSLLVVIVILFGCNIWDVESFVTPYANVESFRSNKCWLPTMSQCSGRKEKKWMMKAAATSSTASSNDDDEKRMKKGLNKEFLSIAAPALVQLAAEPLAGLVDTAYLGRLGPEVLGGAGVAISAQYALSKLYNDPLLRTSISLVASEDGKTRSATSSSTDEDEKEKDLSIAVSSALLLALSVGLIQLVVYFFFSNAIIKGMGLETTSPMWYSALSYLKIRALGTPAATLWLVTNGIFRGLGDTKTPLIYSLFFTALNAILDPFFIFSLKFGASGAAAGTALAQYIALVPLMMALHKKVPLNRIFSQMKDLGSTLKAYLEAGSYVLFRTFGKVLAYSVCARQAAMLGAVAAAAYNLTFQLGFVTTQICEAVAVAVQTLLAREMADNAESPRRRQQSVQHLIRGSIALGGGVAVSLSLFTFFQQSHILAGLTTDLLVQQACSKIFPVVLLTQVLKGLAYPVNGIVMGGLDWKFTMAAMWLANAICVGIVKSSGTMSLAKIWWALAAFMATQVVTGIVRFQSHTGVWKVLKKQTNKQ